MTTKRILVFILAIALLIVVSFSFVSNQTNTPENPTPIPSVTPSNTPTISASAVIQSPSPSGAITKNINVTTPRANETVFLPIIIKGNARVFENQFNYRVRDVNKNIILEGSAYANSPDTGQFGDFTIQITSLPTMRANAITLEVFDYSAKDGKEQDTLSIPVVFDPENTIPITVFLSSKKAPAGEECTTVYAVEHHIAKTQTVARAALEELLKGPMTSEKNNGYYTNINDGVTIQKLTIENGTAKVDFSKRLEEGVGGSCKVTAIRTQITRTLKQFSSVKDVVISIDGRTEDILQP